MGNEDLQTLFAIWKKKGSDKHKESLLAEIWKSYHPKLQVYLSQFGLRGEEAQDRTSELLLHIFEILDRYDSRYAFSTWIYTIARNRLIDRSRKKRLHLEAFEEHHSPESSTPETEVLKEEERNLVREALSRLRTGDRELVYLHFYEDLKYGEISQITGLPEGTVKYRMSQIRKAMKRDLQESMAYERL